VDEPPEKGAPAGEVEEEPDPVGQPEGQLYYNTTDSVLKIIVLGVWIIAAMSGGSLPGNNNVLHENGDRIAMETGDIMQFE
jgi:hypothetical protein